MNLDNIKAIVDLMDEKGLTEFAMEEDGVSISIKKGTPVSAVQRPDQPVVLHAAGSSRGAAPESVSAEEPADSNMEEIKAPFVGTFYRASSPDAEPYASVGMQVEPDKTLCLIEAMKVMNEIKSDMRGIVREVLVENAHPVQYGQPLFRIEKI